MNKRGEENHWWIVSGAILILIFVGVIVFFNYGIAFPKLKEGFKSIADTEAIKKAYKETIGKESALTEEERKVIDGFNLFFQKNFAVDDDGCVKKVSFDEIKGKGFGIRVEGKDVFAEKEDKARVYPLSISSIMNLYFVDKDADRFSIDENFENINDEFELMDVVYVKDKKVYFLDKVTAADFSGKYSDVVKMRDCGDKSEKKDVVRKIEGDEIISEYLKNDFSYSQQSYNYADLIIHLSVLRKSRFEDLPSKVYNKWENFWKRRTTDYFVNKENYENPEKCLKLIVSDGESFSYGEESVFLGQKIGEGSITLVDGRVFKLELKPSIAVDCSKLK